MTAFVEELTSVRLFNGLTIHGYLMGEKSTVKKLKQCLPLKLIEIVEDEGLSYVPVIVSTPLVGGGEVVRELVSSKECTAKDKIQKVIDGTENVFLTIFWLESDCYDCEKIMALHD